MNSVVLFSLFETLTTIFFCFPSLFLSLSVVFLHVAGKNLCEQIALFGYYLNGGGWYYN